MTFQQLTYVMEISRCGSINKTAQKLFVAQSSISSAIQELERELGIRLFVRNNRGVELTRDGKEFLGYADTLLEQKRHIEKIYQSGRPNAPVPFCVSTQRYPFAEDAFIRLLRQARADRIHFSIKEAGMDAVIEDVYDHTADLGVIFLSHLTEKMIRGILKRKEIEFFELAAIQPGVFVRRHHPLAARRSVEARDLEGYTYLSFEHSRGVPMDLSEEIHLLSFQKPRRVVTVNDRAIAVNIIACTDAITTGSGLLAEGLMDTRMVSIPLASEDRMHLGWIKPKNSKLSPVALEFTAHLKRSIDDAIEYTARVRRELAGTVRES